MTPESHPQTHSIDQLAGWTGSKLVLIIGSPRSGTSWIQRMLGAHPAVATTQETGLLNEFCSALYAVWEEQIGGDDERWHRRRHRGLPAVLTTERFDSLVRYFAASVYAEVLALKPSAHIVVDKNPEYALCLPVVRRLMPEAWVFHIVRDGRDVAASMMAAAGGWGQDWAPTDVGSAAEQWEMYVRHALKAEEGGRYLQIQYEQLVTDTDVVLEHCLGTLEITSSYSQRELMVAQADAQRVAGTSKPDSLLWAGEVIKRLGSPPTEPAGFFRSSEVGKRRKSWTQEHEEAFDRVAGDLLVELGYEGLDRDRGKSTQ